MDIIEDNIPFGYKDPKNAKDIIRLGGCANSIDEDRLFHAEIEKELGIINIEELKKINNNYSDYV